MYIDSGNCPFSGNCPCSGHQAMSVIWTEWARVHDPWKQKIEKKRKIDIKCKMQKNKNLKKKLISYMIDP